MLTPDITLDSTQEEQAALYYFGTLYYLIGQFPCEGAEILRCNNGFRNRAWVESFFKLAADYGCFGREKPTKVILPFEAIQTIITPEIIALVCLADDLLRATYYEHCLIELRTQILGGFYADRKHERILKQLRQARQKIYVQKKVYLRLAYGKNLKGIRDSYDMNETSHPDTLKKNLLDTFDFVPIVSRCYPRDLFAADLSPLSRIYRKYEEVFSLCKESDSLPPA